MDSPWRPTFLIIFKTFNEQLKFCFGTCSIIIIIITIVIIIIIIIIITIIIIKINSSH